MPCFKVSDLRATRALARLNHPICTVNDIGADYLVMELVDGETPDARLRRGPIERLPALKRGAQIADGLSAAHAAGIVHRYSKPQNVMLTRNGAKVLDLGIAQSAHDLSPANRPLVLSLWQWPRPPLSGNLARVRCSQLTASETRRRRPATT